MASRLFAPSSLRALATRSTPLSSSSRTFTSSTRRMADAYGAAAQALPARRPVGAFRGGMFGFLLGSSLAAYGTYYYILDEYRVSNELLTEDIYALQAAVQRIHSYVTSLEEKVDALNTKKQ